MSYAALRQDPQGSPRDLQRISRGGNPGANLQAENTDSKLPSPGGAKKALDVIQFSSAIYIVNVDEGKITADVMRIGKMQGQLSFKYHTKESSALADHQFTNVEGMITMQAGQDSATIEVPILNSGRWNPTTEFCLNLTEPVGCSLGLYLKVARIKVLDSSVFPLNRFREAVEAGDEGVHSLNKWLLFIGFIYQMLQQDGIRWRTAATIGLDQLRNIYIYLRLWLSIYMVDTVFNLTQDKPLMIPGNRLGTCFVVAFLIVMPMFVLYVADSMKIRMDISGRLQRDLARNLFRKFMNYNKQSREDVPTPDMIVSLTQDCKACTDGYINVLKMLQLGGKLTISIYFTLSQNPSAWWACVMVPVLMMTWGMYRTEAYISASQDKGDTESGVTAFVNEALNKIALIADYQQRPQMNEIFAAKSEGLRNMQVPEHMVVKNNMFFPHLVGPALVAVYTAVGGADVLEGSMKLGVYLATISVFGEICDAFAELFSQVMDVIGTFAPLVGITIVLNKATDVPAWKVVNRRRRELTKEYRTQILKDLKSKKHAPDEAFIPASDRLEIKLVEVNFGHPGAHPLFQNLTFKCSQGNICAFIGEPGRGRRTLLELVAHKMFPDGGSLFIPSHLRVLYVSADSVLLNLSLWQNLTFGNSKGNNPFRVESIMKALQMEDMIELCQAELSARKKELLAHQKPANAPPEQEKEEEEEEDEAPEEENPTHGTNPLEKLRASQKANIHLARALIMNPEVMVLHRPFMHYPSAGEDDSADRIRQVLLDHRTMRGYKMSAEDVATRRPRTVFFTPDNHEEAQIADVCWILPHDVGGVCQEDHPLEAFPEEGPEGPKARAKALAQGTWAPKTHVPGQPKSSEVPGQPPLLQAPPSASGPWVHPQSGQPLASGSTKVSKEKGDDLAAPSLPNRQGKPSQTTLLKQELLALGPRPMTALGQSADMGSNFNNQPGNFNGATPPPAPKPLQGSSPNWEPGGPQIMQHQQYTEKKTDDGYGRRCCSPY